MTDYQMNTYSKKRESIYTIVLLFVVYSAIGIDGWMSDIQSKTLSRGIILLISLGLYEFLIRGIFFIISHSRTFMHLYWGKLYIDGYWSYVYTRGGKRFFGIWRIKQDLSDTYVIGSGLNEDYSVRTNVRSVSALVEKRGSFSVLNLRQELSKDEGFIIPIFSKTELTLDEPRNLLSQVKTIRATTEIYGGNSNEHLHSDVKFKKHLSAKSDEDVINELKKIYNKSDLLD